MVSQGPGILSCLLLQNLLFHPVLEYSLVQDFHSEDGGKAGRPEELEATGEEGKGKV